MMLLLNTRGGAYLVISLILFFVAGCGGSSWRYDPGIPGQTAGVTAASGNGLVSLSWNANGVATSYNVYYSTSPDITSKTGTVMNVKTNQVVVSGLTNGTPYYFLVAALNRDGEGNPSVRVTATPGPFTTVDLAATWNFHTLVSGIDAQWIRGTAAIDPSGNLTVTEFADSSGNSYSPMGFALSIAGDGVITSAGPAAPPFFRAVLASKKNMIVGTYALNGRSPALTIFQKIDSGVIFSIADISGNGVSGNGPTRLVYHQIASGAGDEWEYANGRIGMKGLLPQTEARGDKDVIYWDFSQPHYKLAPKYEYLWKVNSLGIDASGIVVERLNSDPQQILFRGVMSSDKTVIVGISTTAAPDGSNRRYLLRIIELMFKPADQALPTPGLPDLAGNYAFHTIRNSSWGYGRMAISSSGSLTFDTYVDSRGAGFLPGPVNLSYYPDNGVKTAPDGTPVYTDFANFVGAVQDGAQYYFDPFGVPFHTYYDYWSFGFTPPSPPRLLPMSNRYYSEHGTLSYNRDLFVMVRTDSSGHSLSVALK